MEKYSTITIRGEKRSKTVRITSNLKPKIGSLIINKWQSLIDTLAKIVNVPSGLIMRLNEDTIQVFLKSKTEGNPYIAGEKAKLIYGLYCETVIGTQKELLVPNASKSSIWKKNNPDVNINMISYLGFPLNWPDGECFGTVCLLDNKENYYSLEFKDLLGQIKIHIENDLKLLLTNRNLERQQYQLEQLNNIKTKFLSLISHDVRGSIGTVDTLLKLMISDFNKLDSKELFSMLKSISNSVSTSYQTLENLLIWSKNDLLQIKPEITSLKIIDIIENVLYSFKQTINIKSLTIVKEFYSKDIFISGDGKMMTVIIRNILSNAIKYTEVNGTIFIRIYLVDKKHVIEIEDTGIGIKQSSVDKLFSYNKNHTMQGTEGESSTGIGLILVKEFIDKNNAKISVKSELEKGTIFRITI